MKIGIFAPLLFPLLAVADGALLQSGDIIFQTSNSKQSYAIMWASKSLYSHVGIVEVDGKDRYVVEAISKVSRTPLEKWIKRGRLGRYSVFRHPNLDAPTREKIVARAKARLGQPYDIFFTSKNKEIYCSELVDLAFQEAGLSVGFQQKVKELDVNNSVVRALAKKRWKRHPLCRSSMVKFEECWKRMLEDWLITPDSIAGDPRLTKVWSNYPL